MLKDCLENVRKNHPLIHCITNYVTVNDVANMILAAGGSPIMADEPCEAAEITEKCNGLVLNMGTISPRRAQAYLNAGIAASRAGHPVVLDPVGLGISTYRRETAEKILREVTLTVIRGNLSEILTLATGENSGRGVDAVSSSMDEEQLITLLKETAGRMHCILCISGETDYVCDEKKCYVIHNGRSEMSRITGTGCQLTGLIAAFVSANKGNETEACAAAVCTMGLAGEFGYSHLQSYEGNASYRNRIIDAVYCMDGNTLEQGANYEIH